MTREYCPLCGHITKFNEEDMKRFAENGKKGGRPINPNSKRQIKMRNKLKLEQSKV